jgi:succinate dehydrogenase/fumarate reductase flavoprotein subunit
VNTAPEHDYDVIGSGLGGHSAASSAAGLEVDAEARVENEADEPIPGLYAVGEAAGGIVGKYLGGGNTLGAALIFGRIAGRHAMRHVKNDLGWIVAA